MARTHYIKRTLLQQTVTSLLLPRLGARQRRPPLRTVTSLEKVEETGKRQLAYCTPMTNKTCRSAHANGNVCCLYTRREPQAILKRAETAIDALLAEASRLCGASSPAKVMKSHQNTRRQQVKFDGKKPAKRSTVRTLKYILQVDSRLSSRSH